MSRARHVSLTLLAIAIAAAAVAGGVAVAEEAAGAGGASDEFESVYGAECKRVEASPGAADDAALAVRMVADLKAKEPSPELAAAVCDKAYELGVKAAPGWEAAVEAMEILAERSPDKAGACWDRIAAIRQKQFDTSRGPRRTVAGEMLIEALIFAGDSMQRAGATAEASALYEKAMKTATIVRSDRQEEIQARQEAVAAGQGASDTRQKAEARAADLKAKLEADPKDAATRKALVQAYLVDLDDPARAGPLVDESFDGQTRECLAILGKPAAQVTDSECLAVAQWYEGLAGGASAASKPAMLRRVKASYTQYLALHKAEDAIRSQVAAGLKSTNEALAALAPAPVGGGVVGPGRWVDLLASIDTAADVIFGQWGQSAGGGLSVRGRDRASTLQLPCALEGGYELDLVIHRVKGKGYGSVALPAGDAAVGLSFGFAGQKTSLWDTKDALPRTAPGNLEISEDYEFSIRVMPVGALAEITVLRGREPYLQWKGRQADMSVPAQWDVKDRKRLALNAFYGETVFKRLRIRMLSGRLRMMR